MRWIQVIFILAVAFTATAQYRDAGVNIETDKFEGTPTCGQTVNYPMHPNYLTLVALKDNDGTLALVVTRHDLESDGVVYNLYGVQPGDELLFRFPKSDEVVRFDVAMTEAEFERDLRFEENTPILPSQEFLERLFTTTGDVRYRLSATDGTNHDDTLPTDFLNEFSKFLEECL